MVPEAALGTNSTIGTARVVPQVVDHSAVNSGHTYKIKFQVDSVSNLRVTKQLRHKNDILYTNSGFTIYDQALGDSIIYSESKDSFTHNNILSDVEVIESFDSL